MKEKKAGRPFDGETKKSISVTVRVEPIIRELINEKFVSFQKFVDHYSYKLAPERKPVKRKK